MNDSEVVAPSDQQVMYLGISGVLHPSFSFYRYVHGREAAEDGHREYQSVPALHDALQGWPAVALMLTSTQPWAHGLPAVLEKLGPLAQRVVGFTFHDLTTRVPHRRNGRPMDEMDYWRLHKSQIVRRHVKWSKPRAWVALDDEDILWSEDEREHLVLTRGTLGLHDPVAMDRLLWALEHNFGPPSRRPPG
ncbi:HAD domain-containing protein [Roseateles sp.]|uniref:HAD domain-containing protein n=1 Tax=Roseateles sp. TaxID=1971397 RepID=UPI0031DEE21A